MDWIDALGYAGAVMSCLMVAPQTIKTFRQRRDPHALAGVSLLAMCCVILNATIWAAWAVLSQSYPAGIPSLVNGPAACFAVYAIVRARRAPRHIAHSASTGCGCGWPDNSTHHLLVTTRPGYGTTLPCPGQPVPEAWGRIVATVTP